MIRLVCCACLLCAGLSCIARVQWIQRESGSPPEKHWIPVCPSCEEVVDFGAMQCANPDCGTLLRWHDHEIYAEQIYGESTDTPPTADQKSAADKSAADTPPTADRKSAAKTDEGEDEEGFDEHGADTESAAPQTTTTEEVEDAIGRNSDATTAPKRQDPADEDEEDSGDEDVGFEEGENDL